MHRAVLPLAAGALVLGCLVAQPFARAFAAPRFAVLAHIPGPSGGWDYSTIDPAAERLYLARAGGVLAMDLLSHRITPVMVKGDGVHIAAPAGSSGLVVETNGHAGTVSIFQSGTGRITATLKVGDAPDAAVYDPSTRLVAVINHRGGTVALIDPRKAAVVRTIAVGGELEFAAPSGDGKLYLNVSDAHTVAVLDLNAGTVVGRFVMQGCRDASGLAFDAADGLIASVCGNGVTKILHAADGTEAASLPTGLGSDGVIYDGNRKLLFVPAADEESLSVITLGAGQPAIVQKLGTGPGARSGTLDPATGLIYLPSAKLTPPMPPHRWPTPVPGSFAILVVGQR